jgi:hypothetical protein
MDKTFDNLFETLDLTNNSKPTSVRTEMIEVEVGTDSLVGDYAHSFIAEAHRVAPLSAEKVNLTDKEITNYCDFLLAKRIEQVHENCPEWRKLKTLWVPVFIQYVLRMIGRVDIFERGLTMMPTMEKDDIITLPEAFAISEKLGSLSRDLQMVQDAMPRSIYGDKDVMTSAMIAGYARSMEDVGHVSATYVAAFLGAKLKNEVAFKVLYRVQYDDAEFIRTALIANKAVMGVVGG